MNQTWARLIAAKQTDQGFRSALMHACENIDIEEKETIIWINRMWCGS